ncbi:MAG: hypothetical protein LUH06_02720, partial [Oscillospiraceae bacterium]|nr:hypothetical protein [Oscillospiraceae bacterium]
TGYAWMKMLLCAAGYNASEEGMVGTTWEIGVATLAKDQDVTDDISGVSYSASVSRDVACKLAYNMALETTYVKWKSSTGGMTVTTSDGTTVTQSESGDYKYYETDGNGNFTQVDERTAGTDYATFLEYVWEAIVKHDARDDFGRPAKKYTSIADIDVDITIVEDPEVSINARTSPSSLASLLSGYKFVIQPSSDGKKTELGTQTINNSITDLATAEKYGESAYIVVDVYLNGDSLASFIGIGEDKTLCEVIEAYSEDGTVAYQFNANGTLIEFYADNEEDDKIITDIIITHYTVGELTTASTSGTTTTYKVQGQSGSYYYYSDDLEGSTAVVTGGSVAKNDIVTYAIGNYDGADVLYIYPTTSVEGYLSGYTTSGTNGRVTLDDTSYGIGLGVVFETSDKPIRAYGQDELFDDYVDEDVTLYLDQYGYAVDIDGETSGTSSASNYVFVIETEVSASWGESEYEVRYITQDGVRTTVYADDDSSDVLGNKDREVYEWLKRSNSADSSGYYDFDEIGSSYSTITGTLNNNRLRSSQSTIISSSGKDDDNSVINDPDNISSAKADSNTVFILRTKSSTYKVYSGLSKLPSYDFIVDTPAYALIKNSTGYAVAVYVDVYAYDGDNSGDDDDEIMLLLSGNGGSYTGSGYDSSVDDTYYTYDVVCNGSKTTIRSDDPDLLDNLSKTANSGVGQGIVTYSVDSSSGWITDVDEVAYSSDDPDDKEKYDYFEILSDGNTEIDFSDPTLSFTTTDGSEESITLVDDCEVYYLYGSGYTFVSCDDGYDLEGTPRSSATTHLLVVYKSSTNHNATAVYLWSSSALK